jgi:hypothetical protein
MNWIEEAILRLAYWYSGSAEHIRPFFSWDTDELCISLRDIKGKGRSGE